MMTFDSKPEWQKPAPPAYRLAHWLRFAFPRRVVSSEPPENLGTGLRVVLTLKCGHVFHVKPGKRLPKRWFCSACAHAWLKGRKGPGERNRRLRSPEVDGL
jgi:hypothetical protein